MGLSWKKNQTDYKYSSVLADDYVQVDSKIKRDTIDLCIKTKNRIFSINVEDRKRMYKEMNQDYGDPHVTHLMKVGKVKGKKQEIVIGYDEDDREYILNMKWCQRNFTEKNAGNLFLEELKKAPEGVKIRCPDGDVKDEIEDENCMPKFGPKIRYIQHDLMACSVFSLASALNIIGDTVMEKVIRDKYDDIMSQVSYGSLFYINQVMRGGKGFRVGKGVKYYASRNMKVNELSYSWLLSNVSDNLKVVRIRL